MELRLALRLPLCLSLLFFNRCHGGSVLQQMNADSSSVGFDPTRVTQLSWSPRAFLYKAFLTENECDHLIHLARDKLEQSLVVDNLTGKTTPSHARTSSGMFLKRAQNPNRILNFRVTENGETIQVLRYERGQKYEPHFDYILDNTHRRLGGHRTATVLMYLSDVEKGGETVFPYATVHQPKNGSWSECAKQGYADIDYAAVKPSKGDALLFFSLHPDATTDERSLHGSCPVIEGEKWSATRWIHVGPVTNRPSATDEDCVDQNPKCPGWAISGECHNNPLYMIGNNEIKGSCRQSCNPC